MVLGSIAMLIAIPLMGVLYLIIAGAYIFLSSLLLKQANSLQGGTPDLDKFAASYYNFWKTSVIIMIIMFVLSLLVGVIVGAAGSGLF
jgi:cytochrome b561